MPRQARLVVPGQPHHVVQRGARAQTVFFDADDYSAYLEHLGARSRDTGCAVWGYCLMPNHVHLIVVPPAEDSLRAMLAPVHRAHGLRINRRKGWHGHLWQERFHSFAMDESHLVSAARYIERNPVRAGLVRQPQGWRWSSARAHLEGEDDGVVSVAPLLDLVPDWATYLDGEDDEAELMRLRGHVNSGRPLGSDPFLDRLEAASGRRLRPAKRGRKPKRRLQIDDV
jgi:putative transposase